MLKTTAASLLAAIFLAGASLSGAAPKAEPPVPGYATRADVRAFIAEMVAEHGFDRAALARLFAAARHQRGIVAAMDRPIAAPPKWYEYSRSFLAAARVDAGAAFWAEHEDLLGRAEAQFGVPAEIIVAILGIETYYGRNTGNYRTLDALSTLAFDYPRRAVFFRGELKQFLLLARELSMPPLAAKSSFAGALGMPQFMPGSYRSFAIDFDGDGRVDLWSSAADVIGSVANYLSRHDWQPGQPVLLPATIDAGRRDETLRKLDGGLSERRAMEAWAGDGVAPAAMPDGLAPDPVGLLSLEEKTDGAATDSYWIACHNFYVLTRYNRSRLYAAAVWNLAQAVKAAKTTAGRG